MGYAALFAVGHCVTARMEIKLKQVVHIGDTLVITSSVRKKNRKLVDTVAAVALPDSTILAESTGTHYVVDNDISSGSGNNFES